jgi:hypothetical protein
MRWHQAGSYRKKEERMSLALVESGSSNEKTISETGENLSLGRKGCV